MKKHLSVFCLMARSSFYKVILLILAMALVQILSFLQNFEKVAEENIVPLAEIVDSSFVSIPFWIALIGIIYFLARKTHSSNTFYTYSRLNISYNLIIFWKALYSLLCIFLLWMVQICLFIVFCQYYTANAGSLIAEHQNIAMAFYLSDFMYTLCPVGNAMGFLCLFLLALLVPCSVIGETIGRNNLLNWWMIWVIINPKRSGHPTYGVYAVVVLSILVLICLGFTIYGLKHHKDEKYEVEEGGTA